MQLAWSSGTRLGPGHRNTMKRHTKKCHTNVTHHSAAIKVPRLNELFSILVSLNITVEETEGTLKVSETERKRIFTN